jgi:hypothetical protein
LCDELNTFPARKHILHADKFVTVEVHTAVWLEIPFMWDMTLRHWVIDFRLLEGRIVVISKLWTSADEGTRFVRNFVNRLPGDAASCPKGTKSS